MNFNKTTSYSINVLNFMAENPQVICSANFLHEKLGIPHQYLRQLLTALAKNGFIEGTRGRSGGFTLSRPVDQIFLADIIDSIEGLDVFSTCIMGFKECPFDNKCAMHQTWSETRENIINILKSTSIADFRKTEPQ